MTRRRSAAVVRWIALAATAGPMIAAGAACSGGGSGSGPARSAARPAGHGESDVQRVPPDEAPDDSAGRELAAESGAAAASAQAGSSATDAPGTRPPTAAEGSPRPPSGKPRPGLSPPDHAPPLRPDTPGARPSPAEPLPQPRAPIDLTPPLYRADLRPLLLQGGLSNQRVTAANPRGLHPRWVEGDTVWLYGMMTSARTDRVVFRAPAGGEVGGAPLTFSHWHTLSARQQQAMRGAISRFESGGLQRRVGVYVRCYADDPKVFESRNPAPIDPEDPKIWGWWTENILPWVQSGADEVWLDGGGGDDPAMRAAVVKLAERCRREWGIRIGVEAIPVVKGGEPDWEYMRHVPAMATWRFVYHRMVARRKEWRVPPGFEVHVLLKQGAPEVSGSDFPSPTERDVAMLAERGFVISWTNGRFALRP